MVGQLGLSPEYVLFEMTITESNLIYKGWFEGVKRNMEDNRRICYNTYRGSLMVAQSFGGKIKDISIEEFMPFEWDIKNNKNNKDNNKNTKTQPQYSTRKEFDEMKEMMNEFNKQ